MANPFPVSFKNGHRHNVIIDHQGLQTRGLKQSRAATQQSTHITASKHMELVNPVHQERPKSCTQMKRNQAKWKAAKAVDAKWHDFGTARRHFGFCSSAKKAQKPEGSCIWQLAGYDEQASTETLSKISA